MDPSKAQSSAPPPATPQALPTSSNASSATSSATTTPDTPSFAQTLFLHNNSKPSKSPSIASSPSVTSLVSNSSSSGSTAAESDCQAFKLSPSLVPSPSAVNDPTELVRRREELTKSRHYHELNVPLPPVPGNPTSRGTPREEVVSITESLLDEYDDDDAMSIGEVYTTTAGGDPRISYKNNNTNGMTDHAQAPPVPPKDDEFLRLAPRTSRVEPLAYVDATAPRPTSNHYIPFYHTQRVSDGHDDSVVRENTQQVFGGPNSNSGYTSYTQMYDMDPMARADRRRGSSESRASSSLGSDDLIVLEEDGESGHRKQWSGGFDAKTAGSVGSRGSRRSQRRHSANVKNNSIIFGQNFRHGSQGYFPTSHADARSSNLSLTSRNTFFDSASMKRSPSPPLPDLPPGAMPVNSNYNNGYDLGPGLEASPAHNRNHNHPSNIAKTTFWRRWAKRPLLVYLLTAIQVVVFVAEFIRMGVLTGSPVATQPSFNPMIGPSAYVLINMGARFTPCMHAISGVTDDPTLRFPCPNSTTTETNVCSLAELCGMGGIGISSAQEMADSLAAGNSPSAPHQWWRFITPIFLHAGLVHLGFNMLLQIKLGADLERAIGHVRFFLVYFVAGIGGFLLGGNFTPNGIASSGASGSLFGLIALDLLDLIFNWSTYENPRRMLLFHIIEIVISFVIGLLPGLDNFSHIGGFVMGLLMGTAVLQSPRTLRRRKRDHLRQLSQNDKILQMQRQQQQQPEYDDVSLTTFREFTENAPVGSRRHHLHGHRSLQEQQQHPGGIVEETIGAGTTSIDNSNSPNKTPFRENTYRSPFADDNEISSSASSSQNPFDTASVLSGGSPPPPPPAPLSAAGADALGRRPETHNTNTGRARYDPRHMVRQRPASWYTWGLVRAACLGLVIAYYIGLLVNFAHGGGHCAWCKYLSCLPVNGWCDTGDITTTSSSSGALGPILLYAVRVAMERLV